MTTHDIAPVILRLKLKAKNNIIFARGASTVESILNLLIYIYSLELTVPNKIIIELQSFILIAFKDAVKRGLRRAIQAAQELPLHRC